MATDHDLPCSLLARRLYAGIALFAGVACAPGIVGAQAVTTCRPADETSAEMLELLVDLISRSSSTARDSLLLEAGTASDVSLVTDSRTCGKAGAAMNDYYGGAPQSLTLYVARVGRDFAVQDTEPPGTGEPIPIVIFDRRWAYKKLALVW